MGTLATVTLNPALDVSTSVEVVVPDDKLRGLPPVREPGGGGINVARVCARLGVEAQAVVVVGGSNGEQLLALAAEEGLRPVAVRTEGETRQSFSVIERSSGRQYRFVLPGPPIDASVVDGVIVALQELPSLQCLVISGSVPRGDVDGVITSLVAALPGIDVVIDTSGSALVEALQTTAAIVKPSARELSSVVGRALTTEDEILAAATEVLADSTVGSLLVSIGPGGAFLVRRDVAPSRLRPPTVRVSSAVGAGDSLVGGLAVGLSRGEDLLAAATLGIAAGTAAVMTEGSRLCERETVEGLLPRVRVD